MSGSPVLTAALFLLVGAALLLLKAERRFLVLWAFCFLIPREMNARWGPLSFSLTDIAFLAVLLPEIPGLLRDLRSGDPPGRFWTFARVLPFALGLFVAAHVLFGPPRPLRFLMRDILIFGSFSLLLLLTARARLVWTSAHLWIMGACLSLQTLAAALISYVPDLRRAYIASHIEVHRLSTKLGYFDPTNATGPFTDIRSLRIVDFNGGFQMGLALLFLIPLAISLSERLDRLRTGFLLALLGWTFYGSLFIQSRTYPVAIFFCTACCAFLWTGRRRLTAVLAAGIFVLVLGATPEGHSTLYRMARNYLHMNPPAALEIDEGDESGPAAPDSRWLMWKVAGESLREHPLAGLGPGQTRTYPFGERTIESDGVDSLYITLALKWGLGGLIFLVLWSVASVQGWRRAPVPPGVPTFERLCSDALVPGTIAFLALGLFAYPLTNVSATMFLALVLGFSIRSRGL